MLKLKIGHAQYGLNVYRAQTSEQWRLIGSTYHRYFEFTAASMSLDAYGRVRLPSLCLQSIHAYRLESGD